MRRLRAISETAVDAPEGFDAVAYVSTSLARVPWRWEVEVLLELPVDEAVRRVPATLAELVDEDGETVLRMRVGSLDWMATILAGLGCGFSIRRARRAAHERASAGERLARSA